MSCAVPFAIEPQSDAAERGDVVLVGASAKAELVEVARAAGRLVVELGRPGPAQRGRLGLFVEDAIEQTLEAHGATPPGVGASSNLDASLSDQLYRARLIKKSGLTLAFASLDGITNLAGALDAEDSAVLRWWMRATHERPVQLLLEWRDRFMGVYVAPTSLENLVEHGPDWLPPRPALPHGSEPPAASAELAASLSAMQLRVFAPEPESIEPAASEPVSGALSGGEDAAPLGHETELEAPVAEPAPGHETELEAAMPEPAPERLAATIRPEQDELALTSLLAAPLPDLIATPWPNQVETPSTSLAEAMASVLSDDDDELDGRPAVRAAGPVRSEPEEQLLPPPAPSAATPIAEPEAEPAESVSAEPVVRVVPRVTELAAPARAVEPAPRPAPARTAQPTTRVPTPEECATLVRELEAARGPKPLAVIERLFVSAYVPLSEAVAAGRADARARAALAGWASSFDKSYRDAFDALRLRGKRPTMVLDVPDVALRIGRLHGARSTQLVLVDAMRFDLGLRVQDRLREMLGQQAALTERLLLWSGLPSTTVTQLELIGRGPAGLRDLSGAADSEPPVARGRAAATLRRVRAGNREVFKLDLVEARLAEPGPALGERLDALADETADALAAHFQRLPPRTLVMTFGDHGFVVDDLEEGTSAARQGGALPEQVLVPAFAWIVGPVH